MRKRRLSALLKAGLRIVEKSFDMVKRDPGDNKFYGVFRYKELLEFTEIDAITII